MNITNPALRDTILTFKEQRIIEIQEERFFINIQHPLTETLFIMQGINPTVKVVFHFYCALPNDITDNIKSGKIICISKLVLPLIDSGQPHFQYIENFPRIELTKICLKVAP